MVWWRNCASVFSISASVSGSSAWSISPSLERHTSDTPSRRMFSATAMASNGSSQTQPVASTPSNPITTPAEVHTSVMRWRASPSSAIERMARALRNIAQARAPLSAELITASAMPRPTACSGCGCRQRSTAAQMMPTAAAKMSTPSKPLEKYSAL